MTLQGSGFERGIAHIAERFVDPEIVARFETTILAGLHRAGLPECGADASQLPRTASSSSSSVSAGTRTT
jgi:hypothetical protein